MTEPEILKHEEFEIMRTPAALKAWVDAKCEELGATPEAKAYARSGAQLPKKLYDEVCPLALFAWCEFGNRDDVKVTPNLNNDNYDGVITVSGQPPLFVEITYAKDGYGDSLRMEVLSREGSVNAIAPIAAVYGVRGSPKRQIEIPNEAVDHRKVLNLHLSCVRECLKRKANISYGQNHVLVVVVNDYIPFRSSSDEAALDEAVRTLLPSLRLDFLRIVMLGASGKLFIQYDLHHRAAEKNAL
ncbi:MAG: hypothetical protein Q8R05_04205 [Candidatus Omnitrophota bacterium]|nr:hypothetical protein [Candidatus Omnitrophota bacterium]